MFGGGGGHHRQKSVFGGAGSGGFGGATPAPAPSGVGFGGAPPVGGFGAAAPAPGGFGAPTSFGSPPPPGGGGGFGGSAAPSGFGTPAAGGFGGAPPPAAGGFGAPAAFGSAPPPPPAFGSSAPAFGSPPPSAPGGGFGSSSVAAPPPPAFGVPSTPNPTSSGFGAQTAAASGFGTPATTAAFGAAAAPNAGGGGAIPPPPFGATQHGQQPRTGGAPPFGSSAAPPAPAFGTSSGLAAPPAFGSPPPPAAQGGGFGSSAPAFGQPSAGGFGTAPPGGGFGSSSPAPGGFGAPPLAPGGFGARTPAAGGFGAGGFGTSAGGGFGPTAPPPPGGGFGPSPAAAPPAPANPFGQAPSVPSGPISFGTSSSVAFGAASTGAATVAPGGFGATPPPVEASMEDTAAGGGGGASDRSDDEMRATSPPPPGGRSASPRPSPPRQQQQQQRQQRRDMEDRDGDKRNDAGGGGGNEAAKEDEDGDGDGDGDEEGKDGKERELARLKAKIQEKKRRLQEQKRARDAAASRGEAPPSPPRSRSPGPSPPRSRSPGPRNDRGGGRDDDGDGDRSTLARRNTERFAAQRTGSASSRLPADLRGRAREMAAEVAARREAAAAGDDSAYMPESQPGQGRRSSDAASGDGDGDGDDDDGAALAAGASLVGTCPHMCPDEELVRRDLEDDVQLLETPDPGGLHPEGWTLRETAVKRFRRSAADYKLNIPKFVRPPRVLERVCGYLEEWVMERDRQGGDPRYDNSPPPSLDVYQFIWDRTRMVRKDFILQNYVGTGGKCDAVAVRCHERIARWHAMCEHQLSHISDFVVQQSQQNVQELGQTMKTLNQYYDDAQGRSTLEPTPDDDGGDAGNSVGVIHGCSSDKVMGESPVDFDGSPLDNSTTTVKVSSRIIGQRSASAGTAEPEMRGLYILLTMNNDGGMEVLKYAGRLCVQRPEVYNSFPVQLALRIFQAKKEFNYARFFSILRSPSTPYLYACIMFKHVEQMRKIAFRIMAKTFGARRKDTGENMYDQYPLENLVKVLCFEDAEEAREACRHYNITVREVSGSDSGTETKSTAEVIFWRHADFKEPVDPAKGTQYLLKPWKMVRTIESKLNGATRLAVCRGEVSGEGATLSKPVATKQSSSASLSPSLLRGREKQQRQVAEEEERRKKKEAEEARLAAIRAEQERQRQIQLAEAERRRREQEERERQEAERKRRELLAKQRAAEEARRREQMLERQRLEMEIAKKKAEEERKAAEEVARATAAAAAEKRRREEEERRRRAREEEEARRHAEEQEMERQRQLALKWAEEERRLRLKREEEERRRKEEEARRLLELKQQRRRKEEEEKQRMIALEWERKMNIARKILVWRKWQNRLRQRRYGVESTKKSLQRIDPTFLTPLDLWAQGCRARNDDAGASEALVAHSRSTGQISLLEIFYRLGTGARCQIDLCNMTLDKLVGLEKETGKRLSPPLKLVHGSSSNRSVFLFKLAVIVPNPVCHETKDLNGVVRMWIGSRLGLGKIYTQQTNSGVGNKLELRCIVVDGSSDPEACRSCEAALFVVPPPLQRDQRVKSEYQSGLLFPALQWIHSETPRMALNFDDDSDFSDPLLLQIFDGTDQSDDQRHQVGSIVAVEPSQENLESMDSALSICCSTLVERFAEKAVGRNHQVTAYPLVQQVSMLQLGTKCIRKALWKFQIDTQVQPTKVVNYQILELCRAALHGLVGELDSLGSQIAMGPISEWPPIEFTENGNTSRGIPGYFPNGTSLPVNWHTSLERGNLEKLVKEMFGCFFSSSSITSAIEDIIKDAPQHVRQTCEVLLWNKRYKQCLEAALSWQERSQKEIFCDEDTIYVPENKVGYVMERALKSIIDIKEKVNDLERSPLVSWRSPNRCPRATQQNLENDNVSHGDTMEQEIPRDPVVQEKESKFKRAIEQHSGGVEVPQEERSIKRHRSSTKVQSASLDQMQSKDFTAQLEALLHGKMMIDFNVGDSTLAEILGECSDNIEVPEIP